VTDNSDNNNLLKAADFLWHLCDGLPPRKVVRHMYLLAGICYRIGHRAAEKCPCFAVRLDRLTSEGRDAIQLLRGSRTLCDRVGCGVPPKYAVYSKKRGLRCYCKGHVPRGDKKIADDPGVAGIPIDLPMKGNYNATLRAN
jgi:hypothetical protein